MHARNQIQSVRENNFDLIRLFAALQVFYMHAVHHLNLTEHIGFLSHVTNVASWFPGVPIFFVISGFLITKSYESNINDVRQYFVNRFLRIYPALWFGLLLTIIALSWNRVIDNEALFNSKFWLWLVGQVSFFQYFTPEILKNYGVGCPNGSLWTIPVELEFYLAVPVMYIVLKRLNKKWLVNATLVVLLLISFFINSKFSRNDSNLFLKLLYVSFIPHIWMFILGSLIYKNFDSISRIIEGKAIYWLVSYIIIMLVRETTSESVLLLFLSKIILGFSMLSVAFSFKNFSKKMLKGKDLSYGFYIYHMIVINVMVQNGYSGHIIYFVLSFMAVLLLSYLSWNLLENKALNLKHAILNKSYTRTPMEEKAFLNLEQEGSGVV